MFKRKCVKYVIKAGKVRNYLTGPYICGIGVGIERFKMVSYKLRAGEVFAYRWDGDFKRLTRKLDEFGYPLWKQRAVMRYEVERLILHNSVESRVVVEGDYLIIGKPENSHISQIPGPIFEELFEEKIDA